MAEFLTTYATSSKIEEIMIKAEKELFLVSPYLQISDTFYKRLQDASDNNVQIKIIFGKDELKPNERNSLATIPNLELFFCENLHAKCYFNESKMVISSMNMYEFSERHNREMGVSIDIKQDHELYESARKETFSIMKSSEEIMLNRVERRSANKEEYKRYIKSPQKDYNEGFQGYCIRCGLRIPLDPTRPYCGECFSSWSRYSNPEFREKQCHVCGEYGPASMLQPMCDECFSKF